MSTPASAYSRSAPNVGMRALNADSTIRGRFGNVKGLDRTNTASARWRVIAVNAPNVVEDPGFDGKWGQSERFRG
jgi:hypothetical protein